MGKKDSPGPLRSAHFFILSNTMAPRQDKVDMHNAQVLPAKKLKYSQSEIYNHIGK